MEALIIIQLGVAAVISIQDRHDNPSELHALDVLRCLAPAAADVESIQRPLHILVDLFVLFVRLLRQGGPVCVRLELLIHCDDVLDDTVAASLSLDRILKRV